MVVYLDRRCDRIAWSGGRNFRRLSAQLAQADQVVMNTVQQYELGVVDLAAGRYDMARQRFEFVISLNPNFPGAREKLTEAMMAQAIVYTPTPQPTPTIEPTPDLRGEEEIFRVTTLS